MKKERKIENEIFAKNLKYYFKLWKSEKDENEEENRSQALFAKKVLSNRKSVSDWMNAKTKPQDDQIERICGVLGIKKEMLYDSSDQEKLLYDKQFTREIHEHYQQYCDGLGLSHDFMKFLKSEIQDELFPVWTPIMEDGLVNPFEEDKFRRATPPKVYQSKNEYQRQTVTEKGIRTVNLTYIDYEFMKEVQEEVISYIEYLYFKRKKEMEITVEKVNSENITKREDGVIFVSVPSRKKMEEMDRFEKYRTKEHVEEVLKNAKNNKER